MICRRFQSSWTGLWIQSLQLSCLSLPCWSSVSCQPLTSSALVGDALAAMLSSDQPHVPRLAPVVIRYPPMAHIRQGQTMSGPVETGRYTCKESPGLMHLNQNTSCWPTAYTCNLLILAESCMACSQLVSHCRRDLAPSSMQIICADNRVSYGMACEVSDVGMRNHLLADLQAVGLASRERTHSELSEGLLHAVILLDSICEAPCDATQHYSSGA